MYMFSFWISCQNLGVYQFLKYHSGMGLGKPTQNLSRRRAGPANLWHACPNKISCARGIHLSQFFKFILPGQRLYIVMCVCVCVCVCVYIYIYTYTHTHTHTNLTAQRLCSMNDLCYQIIWQVKYFYKSRKQCEVLTGYSSLG